MNSEMDTSGARFVPGGKIPAADLGLGKPLTHGGQNPGGKIPASDLELGKSLTHGEGGGGAKSGLRILDSENHSPTGEEEGKIPAADFELGKPLTHGRQHPGAKIPATDLELGKPVTHLNNIEDPQTQACVQGRNPHNKHMFV